MQHHKSTGSSQKTQYINFAIQAINSDALTSVQAMCCDYLVPQLTVWYWHNSHTPCTETLANSIKLTKLEEAMIVECILDLDLKGFLPIKAILHNIANKLLADKNAGIIGINWLDRFVACQKDFKMCYICAYNQRWALCKNAILIKPWFKLVYFTKKKYNIFNKDNYNFNKTGFIIGIITSQLVITGFKRHKKQKNIQPGNYK